jgi:hypothetical protein
MHDLPCFLAGTSPAGAEAGKNIKNAISLKTKE